MNIEKIMKIIIVNDKNLEKQDKKKYFKLVKKNYMGEKI